MSDCPGLLFAMPAKGIILGKAFGGFVGANSFAQSAYYVRMNSHLQQQPIYGVETRDINKAVTNNPDKFPAGYIVELTKTEKSELVKNLHRFEKLKHSTVNPKAFTEKGLYMLATILKSAVATRATISIIETFTKIRELSRNIKELSNIQDKTNQRTLMQRSGELRGPLKIQVSKPGKARAKNCDAAYA